MKNETDTITNSYIQKTIFIVLLLFSLHFWDLEGIPLLNLTIQNFITWLVCGYCFFLVSQRSDLRFKNAIILFLFGIIANSFAAYKNLEQSPKLTILSFSFYYFILLYFLLHYLELSRKFVENTVIIFGILYSIIFTIQYKVYPTEIFNSSARTAENTLQFEIIGNGFLMLAYLLVLNRFLVTRRLINIFIALGFFVVLLKCDFRTLIAGAILVSVLMVMRTVRFKATDFIILIFVAIIFVGLSQTRRVSHVIDKMISQTEGDIEEGDDYVRRIELEYFFKRYPKNLSYYIIGGGKPAGHNLYRSSSVWQMNYNIVWVDIGLLGFYIVVGGIAIAGMLWYTLKAILINLPRDRLYLNCYFLYLLMVSFTNNEIYVDGIFTVQAIGLYLIDIAVNEKSKPEEKAPSI